jgi:hypothetical protein
MAITSLFSNNPPPLSCFLSLAIDISASSGLGRGVSSAQLWIRPCRYKKRKFFLCECRRVLEASEDVLRLLLSFQNLERSLLLEEEAWWLVVRGPLQLQKQERSNDDDEEEEEGHTENPRAAFMSLL